MTSRAAVVLVLFGLSLAAAVTTGRGFFFSLSYVWGGLIGLSFLWSRLALRGVSLRRQTRSGRLGRARQETETITDRAQVGHMIDERFTLRNESGIPKLLLEVRDRTELPGYRATSFTVLGLFGPEDLHGHSGSAVIAGLEAHSEQLWRARTVCTRRGRYALGPTELHGGDPFGLFRIRRVLPISRHLVVLPAVFPIHSFPIPTGRLPGGEALRRRTHQVTPNAYGVRDYVPGDSLNRIHWRSTAKRDRLIVKEFEFDPLADIWLVLDASAFTQYRRGDSSSGAVDPRGRIAPASEEYAVSLAASLAVHFMEAERDVGFIAHAASRHVIQPERGQAPLHRLLESLAVLDARGSHSLGEVLKIEGNMIPRGTTAVLITADVRRGVVQAARDLSRLGRAPIVVLLDAKSFGGPAGTEELLATLQGAGIRARSIRCGENLTRSLSTPATPSWRPIASG